MKRATDLQTLTPFGKYQALVSGFSRLSPGAQLQILSEIQAELPAPKTRKKPVQRAREHFGAHYYLGDLLDRMKDNSKCFDLLRKTNPDAYALFKQTGCVVTNSDFLLEGRALNGRFNQGTEISAFGCVFFPPRVEKADDRIDLRVSYFQRMKNPGCIAPTQMAVFKTGVIYYDTERPRHPLIDEFFVLWDGESAHAVPQLAVKYYKEIGASRKEWAWPWALRIHENLAETPEGRGAALWGMTVIYSQSAESGILVRATKGKRTMSFSIDMERAPYFFKDRLKTVNRNGKTKPIFHIVRGHKRRVAGREIHVKMATRGLRRFSWNGYNVSISLPGKSHNLTMGAELEAVDDGSMEVGKAYLDSNEVGRRVAEHMEQ